MKTTKRFIALLIALVLMAAGAVTYVLLEGGTFTNRLTNIIEPFITEKDISVTVDNTDVVKAERYYLDDENYVNIVFKAVGKGTASAKVSLHRYNEAEKIDYYINADVPLRVTSFGAVIQTETLNFNGYMLVEVLFMILLSLTFVVAVFSFIECWKKSKFSYSMVTYGGMALFTASMLAVVGYGMHSFNTFSFFLINILDTGYLLALVSAPLMLFISFLISVSNIWLLRREGFRPQNMLGIALGVIWIAALIPVLWNAHGYRELNISLKAQVTDCVAYVVSFMTCMLLSTIACAFLSTKHKPPYDRDYLIILGCCIRPDGTLTPILKGRADAAVKFEREQFDKTGRHAKFVPSGGQGADEVISESEAMKRYLLEQGYPEEQIIKEDKSVNTDQNIHFSCEKIRADAGTLDGVKAGVATTNYHIFRSYVLSQKYGLDAEGISAKTKWYFYPNAFLREFVGLLFDKKIKIAILIALILFGYISGVLFLQMQLKP